MRKGILRIVIMILVPIGCLGQDVSSRTFFDGTGFCSNTIIINSNYTYTQEGGCEGKSRVHFGRWRNIDDTTIELLPNDINMIQSISKQRNTAGKQQRIKIKITDVAGKPVGAFKIALHKKAIGKGIHPNNSDTGSVNDEQIFKTDHNGLVRFDCLNFNSMEFISLLPYQKTRKEYPLAAFADNTITLKLNANEIAFQYSIVDFYKKTKPTVVRLRKTSIAVGDGQELWILREKQ